MCGGESRLSMNHRRARQVLECASLLALWQWRRANRKRQRTGAVQDATARSAGSWSQCIGKNEGSLPMNHRRHLDKFVLHMRHGFVRLSSLSRYIQSETVQNGVLVKVGSDDQAKV